MVGGDGDTWTIIANDAGTVLGLFHGMFEGNILTFNPGWKGIGEPLDNFTDVRHLSARLRESGLELSSDTTGDTPTGPASFVLVDPDGNSILVDQHV